MNGFGLALFVTVNCGTTTVMVAVAVPPGPPFVDVTLPVVLICVPAVVPVTCTLKVHDVLAASVAPDRLTLPDPATAVIVPPPQLPVSPFGVATFNPLGNESITPTPVSDAVAFGLVIVKLSDVVPFRRMLLAPNDLLIVGGATTVSVAEAVPPVPLSLVLTTPVVLFAMPAALSVMTTLIEQAALAANAPPERFIEVSPAFGAKVPPQVLVAVTGEATDILAGNVSLTLNPVRLAFAFGLVKFNVRMLVPPNGICTGLNDFVIVGAVAALTVVVSLPQ